ncbi:hypothetical protein C0J52_13447 [Blattella germanica]|nr:hypothetical protein C0J52_13447 [Blattella germanica]
MRTHMSKRPFICRICNKSFSQNSILKSHMLIHSGLSHYSCNVCCTTFPWNSRETQMCSY